MAIMDVRIDTAQTHQPEEIFMSQLTFRVSVHLLRFGEHVRRTVTGWVRARWQGACRHAERPDRFVPYY